jgi:hypothetical protein
MPTNEQRSQTYAPLDATLGEQRRVCTVEHVRALGRAPRDARQIRVQRPCSVNRVLFIGHRGGPAGEVSVDGGGREMQRG